MTQTELDSLFGDIDAFLRQSPSIPTVKDETHAGSSSFWHSHPTISKDEMIMLASLVDTPRTAEVVASVLGRDLAETQALLDGLLAIGLIEQRGRRYFTTPATDAYLESIAHGGYFD